MSRGVHFVATIPHSDRRMVSKSLDLMADLVTLVSGVANVAFITVVLQVMVYK